MTWKNLCVKHDYNRRLSEVSPPLYGLLASPRPGAVPLGLSASDHGSRSYPGLGLSSSTTTISPSLSFDGVSSDNHGSRPRMKSYKSHFKQRYLVDAAWRTGGQNITRNITQDGGVVTSLHLTSKYIIVALDNARIHVFDTEGNSLRVLQGHVMGVWAMVPWDDILVSGGCDRDVRVWDLKTG
jgi:F-box and WD-40 domain protein CDC4